MIAHAMKYVGMAERVEKELRELGIRGGSRKLRQSRLDLHRAEIDLVKAYGLWREAMEGAAENGSKLAKQYLDRTTWDLT